MLKTREKNLLEFTASRCSSYFEIRVTKSSICGYSMVLHREMSWIICIIKSIFDISCLWFWISTARLVWGCIHPWISVINCSSWEFWHKRIYIYLSVFLRGYFVSGINSPIRFAWNCRFPIDLMVLSYSLRWHGLIIFSLSKNELIEAEWRICASLI